LHLADINPKLVTAGSATKLTNAFTHSGVESPKLVPSRHNSYDRITIRCSKYAYIVREPYALYHLVPVGTTAKNASDTAMEQT
jgi:hypothetical protein